MRGIRRWFRGTFRPDSIETGSLDTEVLTHGKTITDDGEISTSGSSSVRYNIGGNYDYVVVEPKTIKGSQNNYDIQLRIAGQTATNYNYRHFDGTGTTGESQWFLTSANTSEDRLGKIVIKTTYNNRPQLINTLVSGGQSSTRAGQYIGDPGSPIGQFTLLVSSGEFNDLQATVLGVDL